MKLTALALLLFGLSGCAAPPVWNKPGATASEFETDRNVCEYEALKAVQTNDPSMQSIFGQELDKALRRMEIGKACMRSKGYTQQ